VTRTRLYGLLLVVGVSLLVTTTAGSASRVTRLGTSSFYTGYGFDACGAPSLEAMEAWLASPYRAIGIYLGGSNRACPDGNLTPAWVNSVRAGGWNLLPLWVGPQAPCVAQPRLQLITSGGTQGKAAADSAAARAAYFGIGAGYPIYYDMEGYATNNPSCTLTVQRFVAAWVDELHAKGYAAGVYGSASSTIRDLVAMLENGSASVPDNVWIARWNGVEDVFGEPVAADEYWGEHQRIHQYKGGHKETWGGVTINVDSNYVDGAVVEAAAALPTEPPAGTVASSDGLASVTWWASSFDTLTTTVTLTPSVPATPVPGYAPGGYVLQLGVTDTATAAPVTRFGTLVSIHVNAPEAGVVAAFSSDGLTWTPIKRLSSAALSAGQTSGYQLMPDGSLEIYTLVPGWFGLFHDITPPTTPSGLSGQYKKGKLLLSWQSATDESGAIAGYQVTLNRAPIQTVAGTSTKTSVTRFKKKGWSAYRVIAVDGSGNQSAPSESVSVVKVARPRHLPRAIPAWTWRLYKWQTHGKKGARPKTPHKLPSWYWPWANWQTSPYRLG